MRKVWCLALALALLAPVAASADVTSKLDVQFYGYIKVDAVYQDAYAIMDNMLVWAPASNMCGPGNAACNLREQDNSERDSFSMTARQSRFGFFIQGPESDGVKTQGRIEMDFYGTYANAALGKDPEENKGYLMLRRAYVEILGETWSVLAGNEWMVVSPLAPNVNNYPYGAECGNLGYRTPQIRLTGYALDKQLILQLAATNKMGDVDTLDIDTGRMYAAPTWEAGITYKGPFTLAVTGHYGFEEIQSTRYVAGVLTKGYYGAQVESWSTNVSLALPLGDYLAINGEWFSGANLDGWYTGGAGQGFVMTEDGDREALEVTGYWAEVMIKPADMLKFYVGYSVDDPNDDQLENGTIEPGYAGKNGNLGVTKNTSMWANVWYSVNPSTQIAFEWQQMDTEYDLATMDNVITLTDDWDDGLVNRYTLSFWYFF